MKLYGSPRTKNVLRKELAKDPYFIRKIPTNSIEFFVDIGAQAGVVSVMFRLWNNLTKMFAVEPDPIAFSMLKDNVNDLDVVVLNKALGDGSKFALNPPEKKTTLGVEYVKAEDGMANIVESARLTDLLADLNKHSLTDINPAEAMFKIDCEGGEAHIFNHPESIQILQKAKIIAFELHRGIYQLTDYYGMINAGFSATHNIMKIKENEGRSANLMLIRKDVKLG